jgi:hypothetical protein
MNAVPCGRTRRLGVCGICDHRVYDLRHTFATLLLSRGALIRPLRDHPDEAAADTARRTKAWRFSHRLTRPTSRASFGTSAAASSCPTERSSDEHRIRRQAYHRAALLLEHRVEIVHHVTRHRIDVAKRALERIIQGVSTGAGGL